MSIFRTALRLIIRRPALPLTHLGALGLVGVFLMAGAMSDQATSGIVAIKPTVAVVDHDGSALSHALTAYLASRGTPVEIGSTSRDLQDAAASGDVAYIAVVPSGYQEEFVASALAAADPGGGDGGGEATASALETVATLESAQSRYLEQVTNTYLRLVRAGLIANPGAGLDQALAQAGRLADLGVKQTVVARPASQTDTQRFGVYVNYAAYPLTAGVLVLTGLLFHSFQTGEVRRRNLASPLAPRRMAAGLGLAGVAVCVAAWLWVGLLSLVPIVGGLGVLTAAPGRFALAMAAALVYTAVPLAMGFLAGALGLGPAALNGLGTIAGLAFAFLGGLFTAGIEPSGTMAAIAPFTPTHWHVRAVEAAGRLTDFSWDSLAPYLGPLAVELLFAAVFAAVGLLAGRLRMQTADAG
ncbi:MAG: ABC transporter permease [Bifidobacteriaceae bacterium]|jgi:ABC-2 type transport system permease protein|nr:ABC transporter permease [Bifidobacteriaceae bacterium]